MRTLQTDFTSQDYYHDPAARIEQLRRAGPVIETRFPIVGKVSITTTYEAIQPADIRWRKRPGLRAIEKLPVVAGPQ